MKRDTLNAAWLRSGAVGGATLPGAESPRDARIRAGRVIPPRLRDGWRAVGRWFRRFTSEDALDVLPAHLLEDIGSSEAARSIERARCASQAERLTRASAQLGTSSERFGPW